VHFLPDRGKRKQEWEKEAHNQKIEAKECTNEILISVNNIQRGHQ